MRSSSGTGQRDHDSSSLPRFTSFSNTQIPGLFHSSYFFFIKVVVLIEQKALIWTLHNVHCTFHIIFFLQNNLCESKTRKHKF